MFRVAAVVWIVLATSLAGIALLFVVTVPSLAGDARTLIPLASGGAVLAAMPLSFLVAWRISRATAA